MRPWCGGLEVNVLTFSSDDPSSNLTEVYTFCAKLLLKRTKINIKRLGLAHSNIPKYIW